MTGNTAPMACSELPHSGFERFEILTTRTQSDGLTLADIKILDESNTVGLKFRNSFIICSSFSIISAPRKAAFVTTDQGFIFGNPLPAHIPVAAGNNPETAPARNSECNDRAVILHAELIRLGCDSIHQTRSADE